jgi:methionyl-tRNA formyltransferase
MKVALFAGCPTSRHYLQALLEAGAGPVLVVTPSAGQSSDVGPDVVMEACQDANGEQFLKRIRDFAPDLSVVAGWPQILGAPLRNVPKLGIVNFHPSLLPNYRGRHPLFWAILRDERQVGITLHHLTQAIDAGPILQQRALDVPDNATAESLADAVDRVGAEFVDSLCAWARSGALPPGYVPRGSGSYFPPAHDEHGLLDWTHGPDELERLVRACRGTLPAYCFYGGMRLLVLDAKPLRIDHDAAPGTVLRCDSAGTLVASGASFSAGLLILRWVFLGRKHTSEELAPLIDLVPGRRFSCNEALDKALLSI